MSLIEVPIAVHRFDSVDDMSVKTYIRIECDSPGCDRGWGPAKDLTTADAIRRSTMVPFEYHEETDRDYCQDHAPLWAAGIVLMWEGIKADEESAP